MEFTNEMLECLERAAQLTGGEWRTYIAHENESGVFYLRGRMKYWDPDNFNCLMQTAVLRGMNIETDRKGEIVVRARRLNLEVMEQVTDPHDYLDATKRAILKLAIKLGRVP